MYRMILSAAALTVCSSLVAADQAPDASSAGERSMTDLLGGATWTERRLAITGGLVDLDVEGTRHDQRAVFAGFTAQAISGYRASATAPVGGILGLGAAMNLWHVQDDIDLWAIAPYAVGIVGGYADINQRLRGQLLFNAGPGLAYVDGERNSEFGFGWTWGVETSIAITEGDSRGLGVGLGYAEQRLEEFSQQGVYVSITVGF